LQRGGPDDKGLMGGDVRSSKAEGQAAASLGRDLKLEKGSRALHSSEREEDVGRGFGGQTGGGKNRRPSKLSSGSVT